ncbi:MAG: hypothetical protein AAF628_27065 [Planctomycetota bacterium]
MQNLVRATVTVACVSFLVTTTCLAQVVAGGSRILDDITELSVDRSSRSTFVSRLATRLGPSPRPPFFSGTARVPLAGSHSIDLGTGTGSITIQTVDDSVLFTITGQPGAFSLVPSSSIPVPAFAPASMQRTPWAILGTDSSLLRVTRLEAPVGTQVAGSDPFWTDPIDFIDILFRENPVQVPTTEWWKACFSDGGLKLHGGSGVVGQPCLGPTYQPRILRAGGVPEPGNTAFALRLTNGPSSQVPAVLWLGASDATWGVLPLPVPLSLLGAPGCAIHSSIDFTLAAGLVAGGQVTTPLPIPDAPALSGGEFYAQYALLDGAAPGGIVTSASRWVALF